MRARKIAFLGLTLTLVGGCSLIANFSSLVGDGNDGGLDATSADGKSLVDAETSDVAIDTGSDAGPPPCSPSFVLAADGGLNGMTPFSLLSGYPNVESFFGEPAMVLLPFRDTSIIDAGPDANPEAGPMQVQQELFDEHVGLWFPNPLATTAFDVAFDAKVKCTNADSCADGLIFAWLDLTSTGPLENGNVGDVAGLPDSTSGFGFDMDDFQNQAYQVDDPYAPSLQIIALDETKTINTYPWQVAITHSSFPGDDWHTYTVSLRGTTATVTYDGTAALSAQIRTIANSIVGFTAGTGGNTDAVAIRNVSGQFYTCTPP